MKISNQMLLTGDINDLKVLYDRGYRLESVKGNVLTLSNGTSTIKIVIVFGLLIGLAILFFMLREAFEYKVGKWTSKKIGLGD